MDVQETYTTQQTIEGKTDKSSLPTIRTIMATNPSDEPTTTPTAQPVEEIVASKSQNITSNNASTTALNRDNIAQSDQEDEMRVVDTKNAVIVEPNRTEHNITSEEESGMVTGMQLMFNVLQTVKDENQAIKTENQKLQAQLAETQKNNNKQAYIKSQIAAVADPTTTKSLLSVYNTLAKTNPTITPENFCNVMGYSPRSTDKQTIKNAIGQTTVTTAPMQQVSSNYSDITRPRSTAQKRNHDPATETINLNVEDENGSSAEIEHVKSSLACISTYQNQFEQLVRGSIMSLNNQPTPILKVGHHQETEDEQVKFGQIVSALSSNVAESARTVVRLFPCLNDAQTIVKTYYNKEMEQLSKNPTIQRASKLSKLSNVDVTQKKTSAKSEILQQISNLQNTSRCELANYYIKPNLYDSAVSQFEKQQKAQQIKFKSTGPIF